jgi:hypothetical protein
MRPGISDWTYATKKRSRRINGRLPLQMFLSDAWNTCGITRASVTNVPDAAVTSP